ncbi:cytochrome-c peroxidase [Pseudomonas floridensis]|uniref:Cytochrome-c peroxidase n=1 Tax=Pseudomonas floridensis TaxID=1958950 RepID=A0A1X0N2I7_9PSED|nr:LacI family DNA-binding transcriptional regulator [Pseudomonas floridensis]ORC57422.1 cytochrome-c peroxidase [Pseudomonas floridensis]
MTKPVTLQDVANHAGLSKAAVSRYLNNSISLPAETAQRIDKALKALDYRGNSLARRLSKGGSETIGLVLPDIANPFFAELADAAEEEASANGYNLVLCVTRNLLERESTFVRWLDSRSVDGLLLVSNRPDDGTLAGQLADYRNIILLDEDVPGTAQPKVFADNHEGGRLATDYLIRHGHRRIAHVSGPPALMSVRERYAGYRQALAAAGIAETPEYLRFGDYSREYGRVATQQLLELASPPQAIFAASDFIALGVLDTLRARNIGVPDAMSLVGFDDAVYASLLTPPLCTIRQSSRELGRRGVALLLQRMTDGACTASVERVPVELICRGTVAMHID